MDVVSAKDTHGCIPPVTKPRLSTLNYRKSGADSESGTADWRSYGKTLGSSRPDLVQSVSPGPLVAHSRSLPMPDLYARVPSTMGEHVLRATSLVKLDVGDGAGTFTSARLKLDVGGCDAQMPW